jgi:hypothetical protein
MIFPAHVPVVPDCNQDSQELSGPQPKSQHVSASMDAVVRIISSESAGHLFVYCHYLECIVVGRNLIFLTSLSIYFSNLFHDES